MLSDSSVEFWMQEEAVPALTVFQGRCPPSPQIKVHDIRQDKSVLTYLKQVDYWGISTISTIGTGGLSGSKASITPWRHL